MPAAGRVVRTVGLLIESSGPRAPVGAICEISGHDGPPLPVEVVGFRGSVLLSVPLGERRGQLEQSGTEASRPFDETLLVELTVDRPGGSKDHLSIKVRTP